MLAMSIGAILTIAFWGSLLGFVIAAYIGVKNDFFGWLAGQLVISLV